MFIIFYGGVFRSVTKPSCVVDVVTQSFSMAFVYAAYSNHIKMFSIEVRPTALSLNSTTAVSLVTNW